MIFYRRVSCRSPLTQSRATFCFEELQKQISLVWHLARVKFQVKLLQHSVLSSDVLIKACLHSFSRQNLADWVPKNRESFHAFFEYHFLYSPYCPDCFEAFFYWWRIKRILQLNHTQSKCHPILQAESGRSFIRSPLVAAHNLSHLRRFVTNQAASHCRLVRVLPRRPWCSVGVVWVTDLGRLRFRIWAVTGLFQFSQ